ncbi:uncharacterized protein FFB14_15217 [Fusarium fujikuroi]|nr:uncharacterized protein FFB14_15217 [Fusarium fujikuroi]
MNFSDTIDVAHGTLTSQVQIADISFLLLEDRGFPVSIWFDLRPQPGKTVYFYQQIASSFYPARPLSFTFSPPYAAVAPDALMGGIAVYAADRLGKLEAGFNFYAKLVLSISSML